MGFFSFQDKLKLETNYGVVLCKSHTAEGKPFFHYVMAHPKKIEKMQRDYQSGVHVDFEEYGEILLSGWGESPPPEYDMIIEEYFASA